MQEITLNLPFNQQTFSLEQKLRWQIFIKKKYSSYLYFQGVVSSILLIFLIDLLSGNEQPYNPTFFGITLFLLLYNITSPWMHIFKSRRKFFQAGNKIITKYQNTNLTRTYKLDEDGIIYEDPERSYKMRWSLFYPFFMYKDAIVLTSNENDTVFLLLNKAQVDDVLFLKVTELLTKTVGRGKDI